MTTAAVDTRTRVWLLLAVALTVVAASLGLSGTAVAAAESVGPESVGAEVDVGAGQRLEIGSVSYDLSSGSRVATRAGGGGGVPNGGGVYDDLAGINPSGSTTNCVRCVAAGRDTLNGTPRVAQAGGLEIPDEVLGPRSLWAPSADDVAGQVSRPGSHGIVQVPSETHPSHMLNVINDGGEIIYVDPQRGGQIVSAPDEIWGFWPG